MNLKHAATIVTTGGALVAWFAGGVTSNHSVAPPPIVERPAIDVRGAELTNEVARLHARLQPDTRPQRPSRNLFRFRPAHARAAAAVAAPEAPPIALPTPPAIVPMKLVGMAEDPGPDGPIRQAFITIEGQLFTVKEGETVAQRYRVTKIAADVVELTDLNDGTVRRLALR